MEAKDLMIGDYVRTFRGEYGRVTSINIFQHTSNSIDVCEKAYDEDRIEAIPLTKEILKANGFENVVGYNYYFTTLSLREQGIVVTINDEILISTWQDHNDNDYIELSCGYVHELQHALRACGLNNLADNFTI